MGVFNINEADLNNNQSHIYGRLNNQGGVISEQINSIKELEHIINLAKEYKKDNNEDDINNSVIEKGLLDLNKKNESILEASNRFNVLLTGLIKSGVEGLDDNFL